MTFRLDIFELLGGKLGAFPRSRMALVITFHEPGSSCGRQIEIWDIPARRRKDDGGRTFIC